MMTKAEIAKTPEWVTSWVNNHGGAGRFPLFIQDPTTINAFEEAFRLGASVKIACYSAGIDVRAFNKWLVLGMAGTAPYRQFWLAINKARAVHRIKAVKAISEYRDKQDQLSWEAQAWQLSRLEPEEFGTKKKLIIINQTGTAEVRSPMEMWRSLDTALRDIDTEISTHAVPPERVHVLVESRKQISTALNVLSDQMASQDMDTTDASGDAEQSEPE